MSTVLLPYRGDLVTARQGYKASRKQTLRKFKRKLLKEWDLSGRLYLWNSSGYVNDEARDILGIEKDFMTDSTGITGFGVELKPSADVAKVLALSDDQKDYLVSKCISVFNKYGMTVKTTYSDEGYDFATFKDGVETEYDGEEDEEIASLLYDRIVMYMIDNDSTDTLDLWEEVHENEIDYFNGGVQSKLKAYTYTFTNNDITNMVVDRLFTRRTYRTLATKIFGSKEVVSASTIDMQLFNELLDNGDTDSVNEKYWTWTGTSYSLNVDVIRDLDEDEFMIFIQTHLGTFYDKKKKKWYQKGLFGIIVAIIIVVIAVVTQQYWLVTFGLELGTVIMIAGMVISLTGALIGNEVMMTAGQIVSLVGGGMTAYSGMMAEEAALEAAKSELVRWGASEATIQAATQSLADEFLLNTMLGTAKFALNTYSSLSSLTASEATDLGETITPAEKINEVYVADDISWDYVQQFLPDYIIASTMKIM